MVFLLLYFLVTRRVRTLFILTNSRRFGLSILTNWILSIVLLARILRQFAGLGVGEFPRSFYRKSCLIPLMCWPIVAVRGLPRTSARRPEPKARSPNRALSKIWSRYCRNMDWTRSRSSRRVGAEWSWSFRSPASTKRISCVDRLNSCTQGCSLA